MTPSKLFSNMSPASKTIGVFIGTRPEVIKLAPLIFELKQNSDYRVLVVFTGQHKDLLTSTAKIFGITPDRHIEMNRKKGNLTELTSELIRGCSKILKEENPDLVVVQGDTCTAMVSSLAAFYEELPVAHVEAGLRTHNLKAPFPEELNRQIIARIATMHFAPTAQAKKNLLAEGVPSSSIVVTGNTSVDAIQWLIHGPCLKHKIPPPPAGETVLVTVHRRESWYENLHSICEALRHIAQCRPQCHIYIPVHPGPAVKNTLHKELSNIPQIYLLDPLPYDEFIDLMSQSSLVMTDSGGVQEDACALRVPTIILREFTEREETVKVGAGIITGTDSSKIIDAVNRILNGNSKNKRKKKIPNPFGDGQAARRILKAITQWFANGKPSLRSSQQFHPIP